MALAGIASTLTRLASELTASKIEHADGTEPIGGDAGDARLQRRCRRD